MSNIADINTAEISAAETVSDGTVSIRVSPNSYFTALFVATFFAAFLIYLEYDWSALLVFASAWTFLPFSLWTDRISFDGKRLTRSGILPRFWSAVNNSRYRLRVSEIEQVETQALRALKRGGNVFYRYRTVIQGKNLRLIFASGGETYRRMIHRLFKVLPENVLDNRSIELRDYLTDPKEVLMKAEFAKIPSAAVLEDLLAMFRKNKKTVKNSYRNRKISEDEEEKSDYLRQLGNELRLSGYLLQALEAFRRALVLKPQDGWTLFEFARCLYSYSGAENDSMLERRAVAALRLAEKRAGGDGELLARLGESFFQYGDWRRAQKAFQKSQEAADENFRSVRGLAEIALREGKIAHVIHQFLTANRIAETNSLQRWANNEAEYFSRLNNDEEYMDLEVNRVRLLENLINLRRTALRIAFFGFPAIIFGVATGDNLISNIGWSVSAVSLLFWLGFLVSINVISDRIPYDLLEDED